MQLGGGILDPFIALPGQIVKMYYDGSTVMYAGEILGPGRRVE